MLLIFLDFPRFTSNIFVFGFLDVNGLFVFSPISKLWIILLFWILLVELFIFFFTVLGLCLEDVEVDCFLVYKLEFFFEFEISF